MCSFASYDCKQFRLQQKKTQKTSCAVQRIALLNYCIYDREQYCQRQRKQFLCYYSFLRVYGIRCRQIVVFRGVVKKMPAALSAQSLSCTRSEFLQYIYCFLESKPFRIEQIEAHSSAQLHQSVLIL